MAPVSTAPSARPESSTELASLSREVEELDRRQLPSRDVWLRLFETSSHSHVTHHPDHVLHEFPELDRPGFAITCRRGTTPVAMAILIPKRCRLGRVALPGAGSSMVGLRLVGFGILGSQDPDAVDLVVESLAEIVQRQNVPIVEFEELEEDSPLWQSLQKLRSRGFRFAPDDAFDWHHRIRLPSSAEEYWGSFPKRRRYRLRKERNRIGEYFIRRYTRPSDVDDLLTAAHAVSQNSWQSHQLGLRIRKDAREIEQLTLLATLGALRSYVLVCEGRPAAFLIGHQWNGVYHCDELGFDRNFAKRNPGKVLLQEILTDVTTEDRPHTFDFGLGDAEYKQFFANEQTRSATLWMFPPGLRSRWQTASINTSRKLGHLARTVLDKVGWHEKLRRRMRDAAVS